MQILLDDTFIQSLKLPDIRDVVTDSGRRLTFIESHLQENAIICKTSEFENDYHRASIIMRCLKTLLSADLTTSSPEVLRAQTRLLGMIVYEQQHEAVRTA